MVCVVAWNPIIFKDKSVVWCGVESIVRAWLWLRHGSPPPSLTRCACQVVALLSLRRGWFQVIFLHVYLLPFFLFFSSFAALEGRQLISLHQ